MPAIPEDGDVFFRCGRGGQSATIRGPTTRCISTSIPRGDTTPRPLSRAEVERRTVAGQKAQSRGRIQFWGTHPPVIATGGLCLQSWTTSWTAAGHKTLPLRLGTLPPSSMGRGVFRGPPINARPLGWTRAALTASQHPLLLPRAPPAPPSSGRPRLCSSRPPPRRSRCGKTQHLALQSHWVRQKNSGPRGGEPPAVRGAPVP